jgi:hypothetical protein
MRVLNRLIEIRVQPLDADRQRAAHSEFTPRESDSWLIEQPLQIPR